MGMLYYIKGNNSNYIGLDIHGGPGSYGRVTDHILAGYFGKPAELDGDEAPKAKDGTAFEQEVAQRGAYTYSYYVLTSNGYGVGDYFKKFSELWVQKDLSSPEKRELSFAEMVYIYLNKDGAASSNTQCGGYKHKFYFQIKNYLKQNGWTKEQIEALNLSNVELTWTPSGTSNREEDMDKLFYPQKYVFQQIINQTIDEVWGSYGQEIVKTIRKNIELKETGASVTKISKDGKISTVVEYTLQFNTALDQKLGTILDAAKKAISTRYESLESLITIEWASNWKDQWIKHLKNVLMTHFTQILNHLKDKKQGDLNKATEKELMTVPQDKIYSIKPKTDQKPEWLPQSVVLPNIEITDYIKNFSAKIIFPQEIKEKAGVSRRNWKKPIRDYISNSTNMTWLNDSALFEKYYQQHVNALQRVDNGKEIFEEANWEYGIYKVNGEKVGEDRIMFRRPNWKEAIVITVEEYEKIKAGENITIF